jgi:tetratricopeptide (TPR) repeat protein
MKMWTTICVLFFISSSFAQNVNKILNDADKQYQKSEYLHASELYEEALKKSSLDLAAQYNLGVARFRLNDNEGATEAFKKAFSLSTNKSMSATISYNLGVTFLKSENFQEAIPAFKNALKLNAEDKDCRENLQFAINEYKKQLNQKQQSANKQESEKQLKKQQKSEQKLSRQAAEKILQSVQQKESRTRDSLRSKKFSRQNRATKNW